MPVVGPRGWCDLEDDIRDAVEQRQGDIGPFDEGGPMGVQPIVGVEVIELVAAFQPVEVDMADRPDALVPVGDGVGGFGVAVGAGVKVGTGVGVAVGIGVEVGGFGVEVGGLGVAVGVEGISVVVWQLTPKTRIPKIQANNAFFILLPPQCCSR